MRCSIASLAGDAVALRSEYHYVPSIITFAEDAVIGLGGISRAECPILRDSILLNRYCESLKDDTAY
jgi:hypothetical protein